MNKPSLLMVDDDTLIQELIGECLSDEFHITGAHTLSEVQSALRQMPAPPDYALVDLGLPPAPHRPDEGFAVIRMLQATSAACAIVVVSGQESRRHAHMARALGAGDYVEKPCSPELLREKLHHCRRLVDSTRERLGFVGESPPLQKLRADIVHAAAANFPALIVGETGTGKELTAHALHEHGRAGRVFLPINCAAIPDHLAEPSLFGYAKGAFTGAMTASGGLLGDAEDGTLFLDEIGDLSTPTQGKLLRAIETGEYCRVGETRPRQCRARVVAATNRSQELRQDLYHRISVITLHTPPLRDMGNDRHILLAHFRDAAAADMSTEPFVLSEESRQLWDNYNFPGNIRELRNITARLQIKYGGRVVAVAELTDELCADAIGDATQQQSALVQRFATELLSGGNVSWPQVSADIAAAAARQARQSADNDESRAASMLGLSAAAFAKIGDNNSAGDKS